MTVCWLLVNTLLGVGMQVVAEAVALGSTLDLPRELLFDKLANQSVGLNNDYCRQGEERGVEHEFNSIM
jgi:hypothetical protein